MVVVIIGVLATIAVPTFENYRAKARMTEAKVSLGAMLTKQEAFYAEYSSYVVIIPPLGYRTSGKANYALGFLGVSAPARIISGVTIRVGTPTFVAFSAPRPPNYTGPVLGVRQQTSAAPGRHCKGYHPSANFSHFNTRVTLKNMIIIGAAGAITDSSKHCDIWTINSQDRKLTHFRSSL